MKDTRHRPRNNTNIRDFFKLVILVMCNFAFPGANQLEERQLLSSEINMQPTLLHGEQFFADGLFFVY